MEQLDSHWTDLVKTGIGDFYCSLLNFTVPVKIRENNKKLSKKTNAHLRLLWLLILRGLPVFLCL